MVFPELQVASSLGLEALEKMINHALALDPESLAKIQALEGAVIALDIEGLGLKCFLLPCRDGIRLQQHCDGEPDVTLRGAPLSLLRLGLSRRPAGLFGSHVTIDGDVALGRRLQRIIDELDIDWEEQLSHLLGDSVAHQLGVLARAAGHWGRKAADTLGLNAAEYFQEERRDLVSKAELAPFLDGVDDLRCAVDRLEQRIRRLQARQADATASPSGQ